MVEDKKEWLSLQETDMDRKGPEGGFVKSNLSVGVKGTSLMRNNKV